MTNAYALHEAASRSAREIDTVFIFILAVSLIFFVFVEGLLIYLAVRYRRRKGEEAAATSTTTTNTVLETVWVLIPSVVVLAFFAYGYIVFRDLRTPVPGASDINVTARQFLFEFQYPDGRRSIGELRVPAGKPVKLIMTAADVLHGFYIPQYRIKQDVLPGQYTYLWLEPDRTGVFDIFCTQYCGTGHSTMRGRLIVMAPEEYARWAAAKVEGAVSPVARGEELVKKFGCLACHSTDGTAKVGPTFKGLYGRKATLESGASVTADEAYIRESIEDPGARIVKGFPNVMPTFKGTLSADEISAIIAWLKVLSGAGEEAKEAAPSPARGKELAQASGCLGCHSTDGTTKDGPTWKGLFGSPVPLADGRTVTADEEYLRESIREPGAKIVKGFPNMMPSYKETLSGDDVRAIVAHIKTVR